MAICITTLIPIFITLLLCGFLFVFFNARLAEVKNAVEKQNRVLTAFITNVQSDIRGASVGGNFQAGAPHIGVNHLVSEEALNAVNAVNVVNAVRRNENEKIVVSEDESESEDESDNDSSDDSDEDTDVRDETEPVKIIKLQDSCLDSDIVEVALNIDSYIESIATEVEVDTPLREADTPLREVDTPLREVDTISTKVDEDTLKVVNLDVTDVTSAAHVTTEAQTSSAVKTTEVVDYEHTKVDDLRKIVSDKNLATKEEVKKLKKPELLALLKA